MEVKQIYARRFDATHREQKAAVWEVLHRSVFSRWIRPGDTVVDVGAGFCEFINGVHAARRIAVDLNPDTPRFAAPGVEVHAAPAERLEFLGDGEVDFVFSSNFLEHLPDKHAVAEFAAAAFRVLRPGGRVALMGPNARVVPGSYWDFFDHHVPLTDRSVRELLELTGFRVEQVRARFVPYTVLRWPLPTPAWAVRAYLASMPVSGWLFGQQFLVQASKP